MREGVEMSMWRVEYENDTGPDDDCFYEWWIVTDGERVFKCDAESDAHWLLHILGRCAEEGIK